MTNLKISALIVAATTAFAAPAFASSLSDSLGVEAGKYTTNQLVQLKTALESDDYIRANHILAQVSTATTASEADMLEVPAFAIEHALENGNDAKARFLTQQNSGEITEISAAAAARQDAIFEAQRASEENKGS